MFPPPTTSAASTCWPGRLPTSRTLFNSMDEAYAVVEVLSDDAGRWSDFLFLEGNPAFVEHTGMKYPVGQTATQLLGQPNPQWAEIYGRVAETGEPVRTEEAEPRLERIFDLNIFRVGGPGSRRVAVLFTDITERKQAEQALLDSEARLRAIADLVPDLLWRSDPGGATSWCNQRWLEYTGQSAEEALGDGWAEVIHPGDREASLRRFRGAVDAGEPLRREHRIRSANGAYRWFLVEAHPVRDENGEITQWFGAATDVHEERLALQAAQEASLAKGQFLAVMSHELRTPLTGVIGFADLLENEVLGPLAARQQEALSRIKASSWHLVAIIDEILTLSGGGGQGAGALRSNRRGRHHLRRCRHPGTACRARRTHAANGRRRRSAPGLDRPGQGAAGPDQPGRQCHQVHRGGRGRGPTGPLGPRVAAGARA